MNKDLYRDLLARLDTAQVFEPIRGFHAAWGGSVTLLYAAGYAILASGPPSWLFIIACAVVAIAMVQLGLLAHEAGHGAMTRNRVWRVVVGHMAHSLGNGFYFSYWLSTHGPHHAYPNDERLDPDMQFGYSFSVYERAARRSRGIRRTVTRYQAWLLPLGFLLWGFSMKWDGFRYAATSHKRDALGLLLLASHYLLWLVVPIAFVGGWGAVAAYATITLIQGLYLGMLFLVNHTGTVTLGPGEAFPSFVHAQVLTSRNFQSSRIVDALTGGLNSQIEHHLVPNVPYIRLRRARPVVRQFCREHDILYREDTYLAAMREVIAYLDRTGKSVP